MESNKTGASAQKNPGEMRREKVELSAKKMLEQWKTFLDEQFSEDPSKIKGEQKSDMSSGFQSQSQAEEETLVLEMIDKFFDPVLKILNSSQYFCYPEVTKEIEKVKKELKENFPNYFSQAKNIIKVDTKIETLCNNIRKKNVENKDKKAHLENKIISSFDSMWESEFQNFKSMAEKVSPEPIEWKPDCEKLYKYHFDSLVKSIASSTSPGYDQEFQRECGEMLKKKTEGVCTATKSTCSFINKYSETMYLELNNNICFPVESDFTQVHENTIIAIYNKIHRQTVAKKFEAVWARLDDLTKTLLLEYEKKFRVENHRNLQLQALIAENAKDFALNKYNTFMNNATRQEPGIFKASEILNFHNEAHQKIKTCFTEIPGFKYTFSWEKSWEKLDKELKELEKSYLDKNQQKIERMRLQITYCQENDIINNSMEAAKNEYRKLMNNSISRASYGKSIEQKELENFHAEGVKKALELYEKKMEGVQGDMRKYKEALISKFLDIRKQLMRENDEKVAREIIEKEEREVKQREQEEQRKKERERDSQQQKPKSQDISKIIIQNSPFNSNRKNSNSNTSSSSTTKFKGGIAIHFSKEGVNIGSIQKSGFTLIAKNLPPVIAFTQTQILIGEEAASISTSSYDPTIFKFSLFDLLKSNQRYSQAVMINGERDWVRTEEILAIFFYKIVNMIQNVHPDFNPSRSFVELVISPFLPLPMKQKLRIALDLAGFDSSRTHLLQSTMAMALSYFYNDHQKLEEKEKFHGLVVIHNSEECFDISFVEGRDHTIKSIFQTGRPFLSGKSDSDSDSFRKIVTKFRDDINKILLRNYKDPQSKNEKFLENFLNAFLKSNNFNRKDVDSVMVVVKLEGLNTEKVASTVFGKEIQVMNEVDGLLLGAAALAGWKAGLPFFSPQFKIQEIQPYHLAFNFHSKNDREEIKVRVMNRHQPYSDGRCITFFEVPLDISRFYRDFYLSENTENGGSLVVSYKVDEKTILHGRRIRFEISSQGHMEARWADNQNPIKAEHSWLNCEEQENANRKLKKIFFSFIASHSSSLTAQASSFSTTKSFSVSATKKISMSKESSSTANLHPLTDEKSKEKEICHSRNELESLVQEVKGQLEKSQSTSKLVRDQIEELIQEIDKVLNGSEPVEAALLKSYGEKLKIRAKRIK